LVAEILRLLDPQAGQTVLDGTVGLGGHARAIIPHLKPDGVYVGLDADAEMLATARQRLADETGVTLHLLHGNYADFSENLEQVDVRAVDHMLLDLGVNSAQLADPVRGFSFDRDGPLDMRFDQSQAESALELINALPEAELADLFYHYGQEGASRKIAKRICQARHGQRITTTLTLARVIEGMQERGERRAGKTHPATRVFQALRIAVNDELQNLKRFLEQALDWLTPGGKLAVISFHSLEDGIVKDFVRKAKADKQVQDLTKRPVIANQEERRSNPRSRSAKLRVAERIGE
jgi:16S rRNA (cytosine1402-N4)-methyltransferase